MLQRAAGHAIGKRSANAICTQLFALIRPPLGCLVLREVSRSVPRAQPLPAPLFWHPCSDVEHHRSVGIGLSWMESKKLRDLTLLPVLVRAVSLVGMGVKGGHAQSWDKSVRKHS